MKTAFVFPGQGAQYVGMGRELYDHYPVVRETFAQADEALDFSLSALIFAGSEADLRLTYHAQPALLTFAVAAWRVFQERCAHQPSLVAGHSLGEYAALVVAQALDFQTAVRLVYARGRFMDEAVPAGQGAMAAVLGMQADDLQAVCADTDGVVELANLNCPGQIVISGAAAAVQTASDLAKQRGARRVIPLVVSGPFHCRLMQPAADRLAAALAQAPFRDAKIPVVANVDAQPRTQVDDIRSALQQQLVAPVRWQQDVEHMCRLDVRTFVEFGPGTVLSGLIRKIDQSVATCHVEDCSSLEQAVRSI